MIVLQYYHYDKNVGIWRIRYGAQGVNGSDDGSETVGFDWLNYSPCMCTWQCKSYPIGIRIRSGGLYKAAYKTSFYHSLSFSWDKRRKLRSSIDGDCENLCLTVTAGKALCTRCTVWHLVSSSLDMHMHGGVCYNKFWIPTRNWHRWST